MDMLDHYLDAVAAQLPRETRDDIIAELRDTLLSQIEDREATLARPLADEERESLLRGMGHPLVVAAWYRKGPQTLLGPDLFPYWLFAIKAGALILAAIYGLTLLTRLFGSPGDSQAIPQAIGGLFASGLTLVGAITLAGAACEHFGVRPRYLDEWRVKDLPILRLGDPAHWAAMLRAGKPALSGAPPFAPAGNPRTPFAAARRRHVERVQGWPGSQWLGSLVAGIVFVLWWIGALHVPSAITLQRHGAEMTVAAASVWSTLYVPILIYALAHIAIDAFSVVRPAALRIRAMLSLPLSLVGIFLTWTVFQAHEWFVLTGSGGERALVRGLPSLLLAPHAWAIIRLHGRSVEGVAQGLGIALTWSLAIVLATLVFRILGDLWHLAKPKSV